MWAKLGKEHICCSNVLKSRSFASACSTREAPIRLERAAERVAENTPIVIMAGTAFMYCRRTEICVNRSLDMQILPYMSVVHH